MRGGEEGKVEYGKGRASMLFKGVDAVEGSEYSGWDIDGWVGKYVM